MAPAVVDLTMNSDEDEQSPLKAAASALKSFLPRTTKRSVKETHHTNGAPSTGAAQAPVPRQPSRRTPSHPSTPSPKRLSMQSHNVQGPFSPSRYTHDDSRPQSSETAMDNVRRVRAQSTEQASVARSPQVDYELPSGFKDYPSIHSPYKSSEESRREAGLSNSSSMLSMSPGRRMRMGSVSNTVSGLHGHPREPLQSSTESNPTQRDSEVLECPPSRTGSLAPGRGTSLSGDDDHMGIRPVKRPRIEPPAPLWNATKQVRTQLDFFQPPHSHAHKRDVIDGTRPKRPSSNDRQDVMNQLDRDNSEQTLARAELTDTAQSQADPEAKEAQVAKLRTPAKRQSAATLLAEELLEQRNQLPTVGTLGNSLHDFENQGYEPARSQILRGERHSDEHHGAGRYYARSVITTPDPVSSDGSAEKATWTFAAGPHAQYKATKKYRISRLENLDASRHQTGSVASLPLKHPPVSKANGPSLHGTPYTPDEDALLASLREVYRVPWDEMEQYFNGRTRGSLQVRYSSKLKDRSNVQSSQTVKIQGVKEDSGSGRSTPVESLAGRPQRQRRHNEAYVGDGFVSWAEIKRKRLVEEIESHEQLHRQSQQLPQSTPQFTTERAFPKPASLILRQRELGSNLGRSWMPMRRIPGELKERIFDDIGPRKFFTGTSSDVTCVAWAPDGRRFAASSIAITDDRSMQYNKPNNLLLGDFERSTLVELPEHHISRPVIDERCGNVNGLSSMRQTQDPRLFMTVANVQFSPDSKVLYSAGSDHKARAYVFDEGVDMYQCMYELEHSASVDLLAVSNHGSVATACHQFTDGCIRIYNDEMLALSLSPSRTDSQTNRAIYPSALRWGCTPLLSNFLLAGFSIDSTDDERDIAGETCLWDVTAERRLEINATTRNVFDVAWNPVPTSTSHVFAVASTPGTSKVNRRTRSIVQCFAPKQGNASRVMELECQAFDINDIVYCPYDENMLAVGATDGKVYVWDRRYANNRHMPLQVFEHGNSLNILDHDRDREIADTGIRFLSWGATSTRLYSGSSDGIVKIWNPYVANENAHVKDVATFTSAVMSGAFSPDYRELLIGEDQGRLNLLSNGFGENPVRSMEPFNFIAAPTRSIDSGIPASHAAAKELLDTEQIQLRHMGILPKKQAVQGINYRGPYLAPTIQQLNEVDQEINAAHDEQYEAHSRAAMDSTQSTETGSQVRAAEKRLEQAQRAVEALQIKANDAAILLPKALELQLQFKKAKDERHQQKKEDPVAFKRCRLDCNYTPADTDEDGVPDNHRSQARIPVALWPSKAINLSTATPEDVFEANLTAKCTTCFGPAPKPSKKKDRPRCTKCALKVNGLMSSCKSCATPMRLLDGQAKTGLCERCSFACFRCGHPALLADDMRHIACPHCDLLWSVGALGYDLVQTPGTRMERDVTYDSPRDNMENDELGETEIWHYASRWGS